MNFFIFFLFSCKQIERKSELKQIQKWENEKKMKKWKINKQQQKQQHKTEFN